MKCRIEQQNLKGSLAQLTLTITGKILARMLLGEEWLLFQKVYGAWSIETN